MKWILAVAALAISTAAVGASTQVDGHVNKDGTYVPPHYRTTPDHSLLNNYSTQGNVNPYTGKEGTVNPYAPPSPPSNPFGPSEPRSSNRR
jgi:hypothetical protein